MLFSYSLLQSFFYPVKSSKAGAKQFNRVKKKLPEPKELAELLTMHSFEVENVRKVNGDYALDIDVLPNRAPDCFSHIGIAREISALTGLKYIGLKSIGVTYGNLRGAKNKNLRTKDFVKVEVLAKDDCPRYTARVVTDVKVAPSPKWLQERLMVCGLNPINNIVDIANYVMLETGQPFHVFDFDKIKNMEIQNPNFKILNKSKFQNPKFKKLIIRRAKKGEKITTLDGGKYALDEDILVIADSEEPLAIAGIKGGKKAEIDNKTKIVVLESANFSPSAIRRASKRQNLRTDASIRFENGLDPNLAELAINRAACLIKEIAGGRICRGLVDFYPRKFLAKKIKLDLNYVEKLLGAEISEKEIKRILEGLGFKITRQLVNPVRKTGNSDLVTRKYETKQEAGLSNGVNSLTRQFLIEVPTRRLDISIPEDLIEEIGRLYGYERIPASWPVFSLIPPERNPSLFWEEMTKDILKEAGFTEVYNYSFLSKKKAEIFNFKNIAEVANPLSAEFQYLRPSLICGILENIKKNQRSSGEIKIFELGKVFKTLKTPAKISERNLGGQETAAQTTKVIEKRMLTGAITGDAFYQAKGAVDLFLNKLGISNIWYDEYQPTPEENELSIWRQKRCAEIKTNHEEIGFLGEISPKTLEAFKIQNKVVVFDIDFEKLTELASEEHEYQPISRFPATLRDLAVLVPRDIRVEEVLNKIEIAGGLLVRDVDLFDIYEGEELPEGKKNFAFHIIYQAEDKTLTSKEIDKIQQKIIKTLEEDPEWEVRK